MSDDGQGYECLGALNPDTGESAMHRRHKNASSSPFCAIAQQIFSVFLRVFRVFCRF